MSRGEAEQHSTFIRTSSRHAHQVSWIFNHKFDRKTYNNKYSFSSAWLTCVNDISECFRLQSDNPQWLEATLVTLVTRTVRTRVSRSPAQDHVLLDPGSLLQPPLPHTSCHSWPVQCPQLLQLSAVMTGWPAATVSVSDSATSCQWTVEEVLVMGQIGVTMVTCSGVLVSWSHPSLVQLHLTCLDNRLSTQNHRYRIVWRQVPRLISTSAQPSEQTKLFYLCTHYSLSWWPWPKITLRVSV